MVQKLVISKSRHNPASVHCPVHWSKVFFNKHIKNNMYTVEYVYIVQCTCNAIFDTYCSWSEGDIGFI